MSRLRANFLTALLASPGLTGSPTGTMYLTGSGININVTGSNYLPIIINPAPFISTSGTIASEIVWISGYTAGSSTATVLRAQEGTSLPPGTNWAAGTAWSQGPTLQDFTLTNQLVNGDFPTPTASGQVFTSVVSGSDSLPVWVTPTIPTNTILTSPIESATIINTGASGILNYDIITSSIRYRTVAASGNVTLNIRGSSTVPFGTIVGSGQSMTAVQLITNGTTPYYINTLQIDGVTVPSGNLKWQGGAAPTYGNVSATDVYSYTIICTTSGNYTVLGSVNKFV